MSSEEQKRLLAQKLFKTMKSKNKSSSGSSSNLKEMASENPSTSGHSTKTNDQQDLTNRAIAEICRDTEKAAKRAEEVGPSAWRMKTTKTNKRFLTNTMRSVLNHNERTTKKHATQSKRKYEELNKRKPKFGDRVHSFQSSSERLTKQKKSNDFS